MDCVRRFSVPYTGYRQASFNVSCNKQLHISTERLMLDGLRQFIADIVSPDVQKGVFDESDYRLAATALLIHVVSLDGEPIQAFNHHEKGDTIDADESLDAIRVGDYDGLVIPGGVANPDTLRTDERAVALARAFVEHDKPVAAICHGPWLLVEADVVRGRTLTSWPSLQTDLRNAGAQWVDEEVHNDHGLVSSRKPADLPAFCAKLVEAFAEGPHRPRPEAGAPLAV